MKDRLQKILSAHGVASRRGAEQLILSGRVTVNGRTAALGDRADPEEDTVAVDGIPLGREAARVYIMLNKPRGYVTTMRDEKGRRSVAELVTGCGARVYPVGRLDCDSEGLLIMTNDGALAHFVTHPSNEKAKTYHVHVRGDAESALKILTAPMRLDDGVQVGPAQAALLRKTPDGGVLEMTIREGRNRQIRRMCAQAGLSVGILRRVAVGGVLLGGLRTGDWRHLTPEEVRRLRQKDTGAPTHISEMGRSRPAPSGKKPPPRRKNAGLDR